MSDPDADSLFAGRRPASPHDSGVSVHTPPPSTFDDPLSGERDRRWQDVLVGFLGTAEQQLAGLTAVVADPDPRAAVGCACGIVRAALEVLDRVTDPSSSVAGITAARLAAEQYLGSAAAAVRVGRYGWVFGLVRRDDLRAGWAACGPVLWSTPLVLEQVLTVIGTAFESEPAKILWLNLFGTFMRELKTALRSLTGRW